MLFAGLQVASREAVVAFTQGDCGYLALAVSDKTGLDVATAQVDDAWVHCGVWISETHIADIKGVYKWHDWLEEWEWSAKFYDNVEEYYARRWTDKSEIAESVELCSPYYPEVDVDYWADWVVANIRTYRDL